VVLVAVEVVTEGHDDDVELRAQQWAQELRFRVVAPGVDTGAAVAVALPGTLHTLADALRVAHDGLTT